MKQNELERAVARQTGESVDCIRQMGFQLVEVRRPRPYPRRLNRARAGSMRMDAMLSIDELLRQAA